MGLNILLAALAGLLVVVGIVSKVTNKYFRFSIQLFFLLKFLPPTRRHPSPHAAGTKAPRIARGLRFSGTAVRLAFSRPLCYSGRQYHPLTRASTVLTDGKK